MQGSPVMREFYIPNAAFPVRGYSLPGIRALGSLRILAASRLMKAANTLAPVAGGDKRPSFEPGFR